MKKIILLTFIFLLSILFNSCETYKRSYSQRKGLMILKNYEQPRNKKMTDRKYQHNVKKSRKKIKKGNG